jgi:hypothetical protein
MQMKPLAKFVNLARALHPPIRRRLRCSFCGRRASEVERLVAGRSGYICDACIETCVAVLQQHGGFSFSR